jgi:hypothetical protein
MKIDQNSINTPESLNLKTPNSPWYHFSIDDVFESLIEVTDSKCPLFNNRMFSMLHAMNQEYGLHVDLELFYEKEIDGNVRTLTEVRNIRDEILGAGDWLWFAPHAQNYQIPPFEQSCSEQVRVFDDIYREIDRFAGNDMRAMWARLHHYSESFELGGFFLERGVEALFSTDRPIGSHRMPPNVSRELIENGVSSYEGTNFIRTQFRLENLTNSRVNNFELAKLFEAALNKYGFITIYSHEYEFSRSEVRNMFKNVLKTLDSMSVQNIGKIL